MKKFNIEILPVIGMSPGNSYFSQETIEKLLLKVLDKYGYALIFVPDIPAISTYKAMGYPDGKARGKAISKGNNLKNKVRRIIKENNISEKLVYIINWKDDIENFLLYRKSYLNILKLFKNNKNFNKIISDTTYAVLENSGKNILDKKTAIEIAVEYILAEFAFLEIVPKFFGCKKIQYIYHKEWPVYQRYISGDFDNFEKEYLGFEKISF